MITFRNNKWLWISAVVIPFALGVLFKNATTKDPSTSTRSLGKVSREDLIQRVTIAGAVVPFKKAIVTAPYNGYVKKLFVKIGDQIKQGNPIVSVVQSLQAPDNVFPLRSPINGTVVQIAKSEGEYAKEGDPKEFILRIDDLSALYVNANTPEIDRVKIRIGQEAIIKASAILDRSYKGVIRELSLAASEKDGWSRSQAVEFPIRIEVLDKDETIKPGMSVIIDIVTEKKENVLTLRHEFIRKDKEQYYVFLANNSRRDIKVGIQNEEAFEILEGLKEGDLVRQFDFSQLTAQN